MTDRMTRRGFGGAGLAALAMGAAGCAAKDPLTEEARPMGDFRLGFNIVVTDKMKKIPPSRDASAEAWESALTGEIDRRFGRYAGARAFHVALSIDGYALAPPGIPVVLTPKSILVVTANLWSAEEGRKVLGPEQLTVFEGAEGLILGSGLIKDAEAQMQTLARNMAARVQGWILREGGAVIGVRDPSDPPRLAFAGSDR